MTATTPACSADPDCYRNDGHSGEHAYAYARPTAARETIRSALKGARGLALDSGESDLDAELGRAIDLLDALATRETEYQRGRRDALAAITTPAQFASPKVPHG